MPEPALNEANVRHLLRRTEFVDRNERVTELLALGSIANAVDNVLAVPANPPSVRVHQDRELGARRGTHALLARPNGRWCLSSVPGADGVLLARPFLQ